MSLTLLMFAAGGHRPDISPQVFLAVCTLTTMMRAHCLSSYRFDDGACCSSVGQPEGKVQYISRSIDGSSNVGWRAPGAVHLRHISYRVSLRLLTIRR